LKEFLKKKGIPVMAVAVVIAIATAITVYFGGSGLINRGVNWAMKPVRVCVSAIAGSLEKVYDYMYKYDQLEAENEELKAQIAEMQQENIDSAGAAEEISQLRQLLGLKEKRSDFVFENATVISWGASSWASTFTINKGESSDIALGDCVVTSSGYLVGQITELGTTTATVTTILDSSSNVGVLIEKDSSAAVACGDFSLMNQGLMKLTYISDGTELLAGDIIMTSGKGGVFPQGIIIGYIQTVGIDETGLSQYATIQPAMDLSELTRVYVIKDFDTAE
jgi:rod shape-determining protein MreC